MNVTQMKAVKIEVSHGHVVCPDQNEVVPVENCRECMFLRQEQLTGATSDEGASGIIVCELIKVKE